MNSWQCAYLYNFTIARPQWNIVWKNSPYIDQYICPFDLWNYTWRAQISQLCTSSNPILAKPNVTVSILLTKTPFENCQFCLYGICRPRKLVESEQPVILMCETICFFHNVRILRTRELSQCNHVCFSNTSNSCITLGNLSLILKQSV